jgi:hypothetical protein
MYFGVEHKPMRSLRMEPQYMIAGYAAAVAAALAIRTKTPLQGIDVSSLRRRLGEQETDSYSASLAI